MADINTTRPRMYWRAATLQSMETTMTSKDAQHVRNPPANASRIVWLPVDERDDLLG